jgi:hypothetical protein
MSEAMLQGLPLGANRSGLLVEQYSFPKAATS